MASPEQVLAGTAVMSGIALLLGMAFQSYGLYLGYRQAKVKKDSEEMVGLLKEIRDLLKSK